MVDACCQVLCEILENFVVSFVFSILSLSLLHWVLFLYQISQNPKFLTVFPLCSRPEDGRCLKPICLLQLCRLGVIVYDWFDIPWLKAYYNFGFDHFNLSWKKIGVWGLVDCLLGNTGPFVSGDWILPDLTIQGSIRLNYHLNTFPNTFYFSYATKRTRKIMGVTVPSSILGIHPMLFIRVLQMSQWRHPPDVPPPYKGYRSVFLGWLWSFHLVSKSPISFSLMYSRFNFDKLLKTYILVHFQNFWHWPFDISLYEVSKCLETHHL